MSTERPEPRQGKETRRATKAKASADRSDVTPATSSKTITPAREKKTGVITTSITPGATLPTFESKVDLKGKKIGQRALEVEQENFLKRLEKTGLDVSTFPQITLKYGSRVTHKRTLSGSYVVTLRKHGRGQRTQFKDAFSKTVVRAGLEMVKKQQPEAYLRLVGEFDESHRKTQDLIETFILSSQDRRAMFKWMGVRYWGNIAQLKKNLVGDARRIGVIDFSKRKTGLDELVNILAHTNRQGLGRTITEQKKYHAQATRELESAEAEYVHSKWYDPRRQAARKRWQRAEARAAAQREMWTKISLVRSLFY